jgi:hypothetical protein
MTAAEVVRPAQLIELYKIGFKLVPLDEDGKPYFHIVFVLYASTLTVTGSLLVFIWLHATRENLLIDKAMSRFQRRFMLYDLTLPPGIFMISIGISFVDIQVAQYFWILVFVAKIVARKRFSEIVKR